MKPSHYLPVCVLPDPVQHLHGEDVRQAPEEGILDDAQSLYIVQQETRVIQLMDHLPEVEMGSQVLDDLDKDVYIPGARLGVGVCFVLAVTPDAAAGDRL